MDVEFVDTRFGRFFGWHLKAMKEGYEQARKTNSSEFTFDGNPMLVSFARHMIEFLESEGLRPCDQPETPPSGMKGRSIEELHAVFAERIKTITGACISGSTISLNDGGRIVALIEWPELAEEMVALQTATRQ